MCVTPTSESLSILTSARGCHMRRMTRAVGRPCMKVTYMVLAVCLPVDCCSFAV